MPVLATPLEPPTRLPVHRSLTEGADPERGRVFARFLSRNHGPRTMGTKTPIPSDLWPSRRAFRRSGIHRPLWGRAPYPITWTTASSLNRDCPPHSESRVTPIGLRAHASWRLEIPCRDNHRPVGSAPSSHGGRPPNHPNRVRRASGRREAGHVSAAYITLYRSRTGFSRP